MLDSGVEENHKYLKNSLLIDDSKKQDLTGENSLSDYSGHGTHVAGILVSYLDPNISIYPIKNMSRTNPKNLSSNFDEDEKVHLRANLALNEAIDLAISKKVKILNVSQRASSFNEESIEALKRAQKNGLIIVAGAGNFMVNFNSPNYDLKKQGPFPCAFKETHGFDNIVCVGSYMEVDNKLEVVLSNFGHIIDVWAWGNTVYSSDLNNSFNYRRGTSMATPKVSAYLANLWIKNPQWSYQELLANFYKQAPQDKNLKIKSRTGTYLPEEFRFFHPRIQTFDTTSN